MTLSNKKKEEIKTYLDKRLREALEWYTDCIWNNDTKDNVTKDVLSIFREVEEKFGLKPILPIPTIRLSSDGILEIIWNKDLLN